MAARSLPAFDVATPLIDVKTGLSTQFGEALIRALIERTGGTVDKVDVAYQIAKGAVPQGTRVAAAGGLQVGGALGNGPQNSGNVGLALYAVMDGVANLPTAGNSQGDWAYAVDGRKTGEGSGAGTGVPCWWSNGAWYAVDSGAVVTA